MNFKTSDLALAHRIAAEHRPEALLAAVAALRAEARGDIDKAEAAAFSLASKAAAQGDIASAAVALGALWELAE